MLRVLVVDAVTVPFTALTLLFFHRVYFAAAAILMQVGFFMDTLLFFVVGDLLVKGHTLNVRTLSPCQCY